MSVETIKDLLKRQEQERNEFIESCTHPKDMIKKKINHEYEGRGTRFPDIEVVCQRCSKMVTYKNVNDEKKALGLLDTLEEVALPPEFRGDRYKVITDSAIDTIHWGRL